MSNQIKGGTYRPLEFVELLEKMTGVRHFLKRSVCAVVLAKDSQASAIITPKSRKLVIGLPPSVDISLNRFYDAGAISSLLVREKICVTSQ